MRVGWNFVLMLNVAGSRECCRDGEQDSKRA